MRHPAINSILRDQELAHEIIELAASPAGLPKANQYNIPAEIIERALNPKDRGVTFDDRPVTEAIVLEVGRPALLVRNDSFEAPLSGAWRQRLLTAQSAIEKCLPAIGRIEVSNNPDFDWVGTGWMVSEDVLVTNRHVALLFARPSGKKFAFIRGVMGTMSANVDFKEEHEVQTSREVVVKQVLFIAEDADDAPDIALVKIAGNGAGLPAPIPLQSKKPAGFIAAVGYPARDSRNDQKTMEKIFGDIYNVKRLSPGDVIDFPSSRMHFTHDCSTLGGNSGSVMLDLETGRAVGLHFAGRFRHENFALKASVIEEHLRKLKITVATGPAEDEPRPVAKLKVAAYADRSGYDEDFLGSKFRVKLPQMTAALKKQVAKTTATRRPGVLDYTHFSTVLHKGRNLCVYSVVNIDGTKLRRVPGRPSWLIDPRAAESDQTGNDAYVDNDLDRGHMVRRIDPVWGAEEEAKNANRDTFHFVNCCPQVHRFNGGIWNDLEDYLLDNTGAQKFRMTVFTGPVFKSNDKLYRNVKLPAAFWKVAVVVTKAGNKDQFMAAGFRLSQERALTPFEGFQLGAGRTEQVPIQEIEALTGLKFPEIRAYDTLGTTEAAVPVVIRQMTDIVLSPVTVAPLSKPREAKASRAART